MRKEGWGADKNGCGLGRGRSCWRECGREEDVEGVGNKEGRKDGVQVRMGVG